MLGESLAEREQSGLFDFMTPAQDADCY